jgi:signal transduction histidine kinase
MRSRERGLGLFGMQERLALVRGELTIDSKPHAGTRVMAGVPTDASADIEGPAIAQRPH